MISCTCRKVCKDVVIFVEKFVVFVIFVIFVVFLVFVESFLVFVENFLVFVEKFLVFVEKFVVFVETLYVCKGIYNFFLIKKNHVCFRLSLILHVSNSCFGSS